MSSHLKPAYINALSMGPASSDCSYVHCWCINMCKSEHGELSVAGVHLLLQVLFAIHITLLDMINAFKLANPKRLQQYKDLLVKGNVWQCLIPWWRLCGAVYASDEKVIGTPTHAQTVQK